MGDSREEGTAIWGISRSTSRTTGWSPSNRLVGDSLRPRYRPLVPATVLDPFAGSGTVGLVADRLQRDAILIEISPEYAEMARRRIEAEAGGLFGPAVAAE